MIHTRRSSLSKWLLLGVLGSGISACSSLPDQEPERGTISAAPPIDKPAIEPPAEAEHQISKMPEADQGNIQQAAAPVTDLWVLMQQNFRLPNYQSDRVTFYERQFSRHPRQVERMLNRAQWFLPTIMAETLERGFPAEVALLPAVESAFKTNAKSHSGASGLWQFIVSTGRIYNMPQNWWYDARRDPILSTAGALQFLGELNARFDGDWLLAFAGYNAGGRTIERAIEKNQRAGKPTQFQHLTLRRETREYIPKLIAWRNIFADPEKFGITLAPMPISPQIAQINAGSQISLPLLAERLDIKPETMRFLNATYRHGVTPPEGPHRITLPANKHTLAADTLKSMPIKDRMAWRRYRVKKGDVLGRIATRHNVSVTSIRRSNKLKSNTIRVGQILMIPALPGQAQKTSQQIAKLDSSKASKPRLTHLIQRGDTLWDIAQQYGVTVADLNRWNDLRLGQSLRLGQKIVVYPKRNS